MLAPNVAHIALTHMSMAATWILQEGGTVGWDPISLSRQIAPAVAGALREGKIDEAIKVAERNKKSHLAKVVTAGLMEFRAHQQSADIPGEQIEASKRALERTEAIVHAELKRGLG